MNTLIVARRSLSCVRMQWAQASRMRNGMHAHSCCGNEEGRCGLRYAGCMQILPIRTPLLRRGDALSRVLLQGIEIAEGDILVISSKAVAAAEGAAADLRRIRISPEAKEWAESRGKSPAFRQAVLDEAARMHGAVFDTCPQAALAELRPDGFPAGTLLAANAGMDQSNAGDELAIGWPLDPVRSVRALRRAIEAEAGIRVAVILSDSCCRPRRIGVTAMALAASGIDPVQSQVGKRDLFGKELRMTQEATADQLATAANIVMGNADQRTPAAVIRDHGIPFSAFEGWVPGIEPAEDLFRGIL